MKKIFAFALTMALAAGALTACSAPSNDAAKTSEPAIELTQTTMKYTTVDEAKGLVGNDAYLFVDVRKAADFETGHIDGAISADMDAAKNGDNAAGVNTMKAALKDATGSETGADKKLILVCYSGNSYAQAATNVLAYLGANMDNVTTLEGGMKAWQA